MNLVLLLHCGKTVRVFWPQESLGEYIIVQMWVQVCPEFKLDSAPPNFTCLVFLQLSRVLRLLKYPTEDSENPPQVNLSPLVSRVWLQQKPGLVYCPVETPDPDYFQGGQSKTAWFNVSWLQMNKVDISNLTSADLTVSSHVIQLSNSYSPQKTMLSLSVSGSSHTDADASEQNNHHYHQVIVCLRGDWIRQIRIVGFNRSRNQIVVNLIYTCRAFLLTPLRVEGSDTYHLTGLMWTPLTQIPLPPSIMAPNRTKLIKNLWEVPEKNILCSIELNRY